MSDIFSSLSKVLTPLSAHLTFLLIITLFILWTFKDTLAEKLKKINFSGKKVKIKKSQEVKNLDLEKLTFQNLKFHDLFNVIEDVRSSVKFKRFPGDDNKTKVFHDFIDIMLDTINHNLAELIEEIDSLDKLRNVKRDELKSIIMNKLTFLVAAYCREAKDHFLSHGLSFEDSKYIVDLFEEWRGETRKSINDRINAIFASSFHQTNFDRVLAVYEIISVSVSLIPKDGVKSFEQMNGRLKNVNYRNN